MTTTITAIAGLGNPGDKYAATRHNAGFWLADELARRHGGQFRYERRFDAGVCRVEIGGCDVWLVKPQGYMNESGRVLRAFVDYYRLAIPSLLVVHDEIDLPVGTVRIKKGGGHGGHNGLRDVSACLGGDYARARIGVGHPGSKDQVVSYVLKRAPQREQTLLDEAVSKLADVVPVAVSRGVDIAMNKVNVRPKKPREAGPPAADAKGTGTSDGD